MNFITDPMTIERRSMEIIAPYLANFDLGKAETKVCSRIIHASGDVDYANHIRISSGAILAGTDALKRGANIFTDVEMVRTGINKKKLSSFGGEVFCRIADERTSTMAKNEGITRSMAAIRSFKDELTGSIVAIGNAPTALFEVLRLAEKENIRPALIIGVPVGFVGAADSKELLAQNDKIPFITVLGTKGGSPIAAAALNALMYLVDNSR